MSTSSSSPTMTPMTPITADAPPAEGTPFRLSRWAGVLRALLLPAVLVLVWQLWALTLPPDTRAPAPSTVVATFIDHVANGGLPIATVQSLGRVLVGFTCALVVGVVLGVLMGSSRRLRNNLDPIVESFRPIAPMAVLPIAILWLGTGTPTALAIVAAELIGAPSGLGFAIEWYRQLLMTPKVFAFIMVIGVVGYLCDLALRSLQRRLTPWADGTELA